MNTTTTTIQPDDPPRSFKHQTTQRALETILWKELSLSLARRSIVLMDTVAKCGSYTITTRYDLSERNTIVVVITNNQDAVAIHEVLGTLPQARVLELGNHELDIIIGEPTEPHVVVQIRF